MSIKVITGPMFCGKSSQMCSEVERHHIADKSCALVKYSKDTRYESDGIKTHSGREFTFATVYSTLLLTNIVDKLLEYDVVGIDEVQFYDDCVEVAQKLATAGIVVICAGLDSTYLGEPFGHVGRLCCRAEKVVKLKAVCMLCKGDASFTKKIAGNNDIIDIGGADKYIAVCRLCMRFE